MANQSKSHIVDEHEVTIYNMRRQNNQGKLFNLVEFKKLLHDGYRVLMSTTQWKEV